MLNKSNTVIFYATFSTDYKSVQVNSVKYRSKKSDAEDFKEVFGAIRTEVPGLIRDLMDTVYSEDSAERMAKSVATFYKTLADSGIPQEEALEMARGYVFDLRSIGGWFRNR